MAPAPELPKNDAITWAVRKAGLMLIQHWQVRGAIAVHDDKDAFSARVLWVQRAKSQFSIDFTGPLGAGATKLSGKQGEVTLLTSDGKSHTATSAEALIQQQMRVHLPVSNLYYWIRGVPAPGLSAQTKFDSNNHLLSMRQQGWHIQYTRYTSANGIDLPSKIKLTRDNISIKLVISAWSI